jgi:hypothetical protein
MIGCFIRGPVHAKISSQPGSRDMQILDVSTGLGSTDASNYLDNNIDSACILIDIINVFQTILRNNKIY